MQPCRHCEDAHVDEYIRTNRWNYRDDAQKYHSEEECPTLNKNRKKPAKKYTPSSAIESPKSKGSSHHEMPMVHSSQGKNLFMASPKSDSKHAAQNAPRAVHQPNAGQQVHSHDSHSHGCTNKNHQHVYDPAVITDCHADHWCPEHEWHKDHDWCVRVEEETYQNTWFRQLFTLRE